MPAPFVPVEVVTPRSGLCNSTFACGTIAPLGSVTRPVTVAVSAWPKHATARTSVQNNATTTATRRATIGLDMERCSLLVTYARQKPFVRQSPDDFFCGDRTEESRSEYRTMYARSVVDFCQRAEEIIGVSRAHR